MLKLFASKKVDVYTQLNKIAGGIYTDFNFNGENVLYELSNQIDAGTAYGRMVDKQYQIIVGIKDYIDANAIDEKQLVYFQNTMFHEFVHADTWLHTSETLKSAFEGNKLTYAYWAFKLLDEYRAYGEANEKYKEDKQFLKKGEKEVLIAFEHYCNMLQFPGQKPAPEVFADNYYDLGSAFIAHKFVNPDFPSIREKHYIQFVDSYLEHLKQASKSNLLEYKKYEQLGKQLVKDFKLLFPCVKGMHMNNSYDYFLINSHMQ